MKILSDSKDVELKNFYLKKQSFKFLPIKNLKNLELKVIQNKSSGSELQLKCVPDHFTQNISLVVGVEPEKWFL